MEGGGNGSGLQGGRSHPEEGWEGGAWAKDEVWERGKLDETGFLRGGMRLLAGASGENGR